LPETFYADLKRGYAARRARMMGILEENKFRAQAPEGAYYVMADFSEWGFNRDDVAFAHYLTEQIGVAAVPGSSFYATPGLGKNAVRFAFAKKPETFDAVEEKFRKSKQ
ncbi:MAG: aminotransferase class I/II-fold pyridoxal phosphate-dependent enzyme, partial [Chloroflexi bacterium]|nr:aminotransferase class I/II-fold pyridoxal phosphate-dependent enzyme [Chloroflexota bacterium]